MHKYFAKTLFLGKKVEYLSECQSTNQILSHQYQNQQLMEGHIIWADHQTNGKGQRGNVWLSEPGENLLFSILLKPNTLLPKQAYLVNIVSGIAVIDCLNQMFEATFELKWPNDVYVNDQKIAGILVETSIESGRVGAATVGIGLNVNQKHFSIPTATSLYILNGTTADRGSILEQLIISLEKYYLILKSGAISRLISDYYKVMRWRGELHTFEADRERFEGEIIGIDDTGRLLIRTNQKVRRFDVKEVKFLY